jgi:adenylate kinase family enzyme
MSAPTRIHVFGASGSGTTTLGHHLAQRLHVPFLDADRYYWLDTDPPFTTKREPSERVELIERDVHGLPSWVLAGSLCSWGDPLIEHFTLVVFLSLDHDTRMQRLRQRESRRYGERIEPGGEMHDAHRAFMDWAQQYDTAEAPIRSLDLHERWMRRLDCPILRLDSSRPTNDLGSEVLARTDVC